MQNINKPLHFSIYPIGVGYVAHTERGGGEYIRLMKNLQIIHINKT